MIAGRHFVSNDGGFFRKFLVSRVDIDYSGARPKMRYPVVSRHLTFKRAVARARRENSKRGFTS